MTFFFFFLIIDPESRSRHVRHKKRCHSCGARGGHGEILIQDLEFKKKSFDLNPQWSSMQAF